MHRFLLMAALLWTTPLAAQRDRSDLSDQLPEQRSLSWSKATRDSFPLAVAPLDRPQRLATAPIAFPPQSNFFEGVGPMLLSQGSGRILVAYFLPPRQDKATGRGHSRIAVRDVATGRAVRVYNVPGGERINALSFHNDGTHLLVDFGGSLELWDLQPSGITREATWRFVVETARPNAALKVAKARFIGDDLIVGVSQTHVLVWNWKSGQTITFHPARGIRGTFVSPDGTRAAYVTFDDLCVFDLVENRMVLQEPKPDGLPPSELSFSPNAEQLAIVTQTHLIVRNLQDGSVRTELGIGGLKPPLQGLLWLSEDRLLMGGKYLVDLDLGMPLWEYVGAKASVAWDDQVWFLFAQDKNPSVALPVRLPHTAVRAALEESAEDLWIVRPGMSVAIDVSGVSDGGAQQQVREKLAAQLTDRGFTVDPGSDVVLKASIGRAPQRDVTVHISGRSGTESASFAPYHSQLEFLVQGRSVWSGRIGSFSIRPGINFASIKDDESFAEYVQRVNNPPVFHFDNARFPDFVPHPSRQVSVPGKITSGVTLGVSEITARGLRETSGRRR